MVRHLFLLFLSIWNDRSRSVHTLLFLDSPLSRPVRRVDDNVGHERQDQDPDTGMACRDHFGDRRHADDVRTSRAQEPLFSSCFVRWAGDPEGRTARIRAVTPR